MKFRPLHDRVVIRRLEGEDKTKGGIIIPDTVKEKPQEGEVIAVGPGARDESGKLVPIELKAGDKVLFGKWSGTEVKIDGEDLLIMKESENMGAQMVREVASKTNDLAGDGTTTATVLAASIMKEGLKLVAAGMNPMDLKRGIDIAVAAVVKDIEKRAKKVQSSEEIAQIATIAANGDKSIRG